MNGETQLQLINFVKNNSYNNTNNLLNESAAAGVSDAVLDKIFELTVGKYKKIDFSDIERSRGDITRFKHYENLKECINILLDLHTSTDKIPGALTVSIALENILQNKTMFERSFRAKNNLGIMAYNTYVYGVMEATSYLIASSVDFVKSKNDSELEISIYNTTKQNALIDHLVKMNKVIEDGTLAKFLVESEKEPVEVQDEAISADTLKYMFKSAPKAMKYVKNSKVCKAATIGIVAAGTILLAINIIPLIKELVYWIYRCKQKISDAAQLQAEFLETNIEILKQNGADEKIISKQEKAVKRFKSIAKVFAIDADKAERDSKKDAIDDKVDASNIVI